MRPAWLLVVAACGKVNGTPEADANTAPQQLTIMRAGTAIGAVTISSDQGAINCGPTCTAEFPHGTAVTLTASPAGAARWSGGGCTGTDTCTVTLTAATTVTATTCDSTPTNLVSMTTTMQMYTAPAGCSQVTIDAFGAQGGGTMGGKGAEVVGTVMVADAEILKVLVGTVGTHNYGFGGGGGTFVVRQNNDPLVIAGGGGAASYDDTNPGGPGVVTANGGDCQGALGGANGMGGGAGIDNMGGCGYRGSGGGGLLADGETVTNGGGVAFVHGGTGGIDPTGLANTVDCVNQGVGGFGGGGAGGNGGGGGGGYSGGAGGSNSGTPIAYPGGAGGGSFNAGTNPTSTAGMRAGDGQVSFKPGV